MMRSRWIILLTFALFCLPIFPAPSSAMLHKLSAEERASAINYGKRGVRTELMEFIKEWSVDQGKDGFAFITTEFLALAYAARQAALKSSELNNFDIEDSLAKSSGKLVFRVTLFGPTEEFAKNYSAVLKADGRTVPSTFWNNPKGEPYGDGKTQPAFVTDSDFYFPSEGINPKGSVTLTILDASAKEVGRFPFNLGSLR